MYIMYENGALSTYTKEYTNFIEQVKPYATLTAQ